MCTVGVLNSIVFGVNENALKLISNITKRKSTDWDIFLAGCTAGLVSSPILAPVELIKTQLQVQDRKHKTYTSTWDCIQKIHNIHGIRGLFKGTSITIIRDAPTYGVYFVSYEWFHKKFGDSSISILISGGN
jgi:solute carrier family 25 carnitine/acylcarnitine transporter 20/29